MKIQDAYDQVIDILANGAGLKDVDYEDEDAEIERHLRLLATKLGCDLEHDTLDNWIGVTILYRDGLNGLVSSCTDYMYDLEELAEETSLTKEFINDEIIFGGFPEAIHYNEGFYSSGVTVYHYGQLCEFLVSNYSELCESAEACTENKRRI